MRIIPAKQGSPEWAAIRAKHHTASEAPACMGASKYLTRADLLRQKSTGIIPEVDAHKQALFDRGHAAENRARGIVEEMIGEDLSPITAVCEETGLLASLDGATLMGDVLFEAKLWNESLVAQVEAGELEPHYFWQLEQQLLVAKAEKVIFVCSDGTREKFVSMEYRAVPGRREQLIAAWKQFDSDLATYVPPAAAAVVVAAPVQALPAVSVIVSGEITVKDNFAAFETALRDFLEHRLIREPKTDQEFATLEVQIKAMKGAEAALDAAEGQMLAQIQAVDTAKKAKDMLSRLVRDNRLMAEKLLASEKERRRGEIVAGGVTALREHIAGLNKRLAQPYMPAIQADFGGCIKGMKSLASMEDKVATELARAKIAANEAADRIDANLKTMQRLAGGYTGMFPDAQALVLKAPDDFEATVAMRVAERERREQERLDAARERIRAEEVAKLAREQEARDREAARQAAEAAMPASTPAPHVTPAQAVKDFGEAMQSALAGSSPAPNVVPMRADTGATIRLGQINERLRVCAVTGNDLAELGFLPVGTDKAARLYRESDFPKICAALVKHLMRVAVSEPMAA